MYILMVRNDNTLSVEKEEKIIQGSSYIDNLWILLPTNYRGSDMHGYEATITYLLPNSNKVYVEDLIREEREYCGNIKYTLGVNSEFTSESGYVELFVTFKNDMKRDENLRVRKTTSSKVFITSEPRFDWNGVRDSRYEVCDMYRDFSVSEIHGKTINLADGQLVVENESGTQYIPFSMNRYYDGIDLCNANIQIRYVNAAEEEGYDNPVNVSYSDSEIRFGWIVKNAATVTSGILQFEIIATGTDDNGEAYLWKTTPGKIEVLKSVSGAGVVKPDGNWQTVFINQVAEQVGAARNAANDASESAESATQSAAEAINAANAANQFAQATEESVSKAQELLNSMQNDLSELTNSIAQLEQNKVDKVNGKGLSANDYSDADKEKVDNIPENPKYTDTVYDDTEIKGICQELQNGLSEDKLRIDKLEEVESLPLSGGDMTGELKMNGQPISGLSAPTNGGQAANKEYVDNAVKTVQEDMLAQKLIFADTTVPASAFASDGTYPDYPYRAAVALTGVLERMIPEVVFSVGALSGTGFAPVAQCYDGGVYIWADGIPSGDVAIHTILCWKGAGA